MGTTLSVAVLLSLAAAPSPPVEDAFPEPGAVLPTNARAVVFGMEGLVHTLERGDGSVEIVAVDERIGDADVLVLPPLVAGEAIALDVEGYRFDWTVGDDDDTAAPVFAEVSGLKVDEVRRGLTGSSGFEAWFVTVCLPALVDEEPILARIGGDVLGDDVLVVPRGRCGDGDLAVNVRVSGDREGEACFDVVAVDIAGNESAPGTVCATLLDPTPGCSQNGASTSMAIALTAVVLRRRRCH